MNATFKSILVTATLAIATTTAQALVRPYSKTIAVESLANHPLLAQADAEAMYLHEMNDGRTLLYVEAQNGQQLTAFDVTDPAQIKQVAHTTFPGNSAFDFVRPVGDQNALIRYRNGSGVALLSFKHYKHPVLANSFALENTNTSEALGQTALLVTPTEITTRPVGDPQDYSVVDTSNPYHPGLLATIPAVMQRLAKPDTGTLFLLNRDGVTVVRRLRVEEEHKIDLDQQNGN